MNSDVALVIPHLSKELNLIGHPELPYTLEKSCRKKRKNEGREEDCKIVFDTKLMISSLVNVCFELVKQIKTVGFDDESNLDKLNFENGRLEKQLKSSKLEIKEQLNKLTSLKLENQQLREKIEDLEKKIKEQKISQQSLVQKNLSNEDILKHALKRNETHIFNLHKTVWKQFNLADKNYFPENFKLFQLNQPNFSKLWSTVKHSEPKTRENVLKKAVCIFQNNNTSLMEENFMLKTALLTTINEIHEAIKEFSEKLDLPESVLAAANISDMFMEIEFDSDIYNKIVQKHLLVIKGVNELFNEASFTVADDVFLCWSKIVEDIKNFFK